MRDLAVVYGLSLPILRSKIVEKAVVRISAVCYSRRTCRCFFESAATRPNHSYNALQGQYPVFNKHPVHTLEYRLRERDDIAREEELFLRKWYDLRSHFSVI